MRLFVFTLAAVILVAGCNRPSNHSTAGDPVARCLSQVREIHGAAGPWAVVGYRIGQRALKELNLPRQSFSILVTHRSPAKVQYSCIADGLQASTGASPGKLNLRVEEASVEDLSSIVEDRTTGRTLTFTLQPALVNSIKDVGREHFETEGKRIAELSDDKIFRFTESQAPAPK